MARISKPGTFAAVPAAVTLVALMLTGCTPGQQAARASASHAAPELSSVKALSDPRSHQGPSTAVVADGKVKPVTPVGASAPALPVTLSDAQGIKVTVKDTSRVLALDIHGTLARTVFELGQGDKLVGRDLSTQFDEARKLPMVTRDGHQLDAESILALDPTLIITDTSLGPWDVILQLREAGVPVVVTESDRNLDNVNTITAQVATALGVPAAGVALSTRTDAEVAKVEAAIKKVAPRHLSGRLRTMFIYARGGSGTYYLFGEGSGADSLIDSLGLYDVAKEIGWKGSKPLTDEGVVAAQPDLILMMTKGLESVGGVDGLLKRFPALAQTPAGQQRRFVDMSDSEILGYGPLTAKVLNALAVAIYAPDAVSAE